MTQGELPLQSSLHWTFQGHDTVNNQKGIQISRLGPKSSMLSIPELDVTHNGLYSCIVSHQGGNISKSIELVVNGKERGILCIYVMYGLGAVYYLSL